MLPGRETAKVCRSTEIDMPASAIPFIAFIISAFAMFMIVVGGASFWSNRN